MSNINQNTAELLAEAFGIPVIENTVESYSTFRGHVQAQDLLDTAIRAQDIEGTRHYLNAMVAKGFADKAAKSVIFTFRNGSTYLKIWEAENDQPSFAVKLVKLLAETPSVESLVKANSTVVWAAAGADKWGVVQSLVNKGYLPFDTPSTDRDFLVQHALETGRVAVLQTIDKVHPGAVRAAVLANDTLMSWHAKSEAGAAYLLATCYPAEDLSKNRNLVERIADANLTALRLMNERGDGIPVGKTLAGFCARSSNPFDCVSSPENLNFFKEQYLPELSKEMLDPSVAGRVANHFYRSKQVIPLVSSLLDAGMPLPTAHQLYATLRMHEGPDAAAKQQEVLAVLKAEGLEPKVHLKWGQAENPTFDNVFESQPQVLQPPTVEILKAFGANAVGGSDALADLLAVKSAENRETAIKQLQEAGVAFDPEAWNPARIVLDGKEGVLEGVALTAVQAKSSSFDAVRASMTYEGLTAAERSVVALPPAPTSDPLGVAHKKVIAKIAEFGGLRSSIEGEPAAFILMRAKLEQLAPTMVPRQVPYVDMAHARESVTDLSAALRAMILLTGEHGKDLGLAGRDSKGRHFLEAFLEHAASKGPDLLRRTAVVLVDNFMDYQPSPTKLSLYEGITANGDTVLHLLSKYDLVEAVRVECRFHAANFEAKFVDRDIATKNLDGKTPLDLCPSPDCASAKVLGPLLAQHEAEIAAKLKAEAEELARKAAEAKLGPDVLVPKVVGVSLNGRTTHARFYLVSAEGAEKDVTKAVAVATGDKLTPAGDLVLTRNPVPRALGLSDADYRGTVEDGARGNVKQTARVLWNAVEFAGMGERAKFVKGLEQMDAPAPAAPEKAAKKTTAKAKDGGRG